MKTRILVPFAVAALSIALILPSCRKSDRDEDNETQSSADNALAEAAFNDVFKQLDDAAAVTPDVNRMAPGSEYTSQSGCATVTVNPALPSTVFPKTLTIDFGTTNVTCSDGRTRRGKIIATFTGKYRDSATVITVNLNNYFVNDYAVQGTKTITNKGRNSSGNLWYTISVQNASVTTPQNKTVSWQSTRQREWIAGESTLINPFDDVYLITGSASGTGTAGNAFSVTITQALRVEIGCRWIVSGKATLQPANLAARFIDFGSGTCDDQASVTINGNTYNFTMN
jgi:hypothetical protein